ncbi:MAG: carbohydrate-binding protein, partial [Vibrionaceae bacterium]
VISATDADGDRLSFSATGAKITGLGNAQAQVTYEAKHSIEDRIETITVSVSDGKVTRSASINMKIKGTGESWPVLTSPDSVEVNAGEIAKISVSATDIDNDPLTFSTSHGTVAQTGNTAVISVATSLQDAGTELQVVIKVSDGRVTDQDTVIVKVKKESAPSQSTWDPKTVYNGGDKVIHNGIEYTAKWWTQGDEPGRSDVWQEKSDGSLQEWDAAKVYNGGDQTTFQGKLYEAKWWTQGDQPGNPNGPWLLK